MRPARPRQSYNDIPVRSVRRRRLHRRERDIRRAAARRIEMSNAMRNLSRGNLVGTPPAGIIFSEWARANPSSWGYLAPILLENNGWGLFITTPVGRNHAQSMLQVAQANPDTP